MCKQALVLTVVAFDQDCYYMFCEEFFDGVMVIRSPCQSQAKQKGIFCCLYNENSAWYSALTNTHIDGFW